MHVYIYIYTYTCLCVYIYIYTYTCICVYTYNYILEREIYSHFNVGLVPAQNSTTNPSASRQIALSTGYDHPVEHKLVG